MALKIAKPGANAPQSLPDSDALGKCMSIATTQEGADYYCERLEARFVETGIINQEPAKMMLQTADNFRQNVYLQRNSTGAAWSGRTVADNDFQNLQQNLAKKEAENVAATVQDGNIVMDYAISDQADFLRGYSVDGRELDIKNKKDKGAVQSTDNLFNIWLSENQMISRGSQIYMGDEKGNILKDEDGTEIRADAAQLREKMNGDKGFAQFMQNKGIKVTAQQQNYPSAAVVKEQQAAPAQPAAPAKVAEEVREVPAEEVRPASMR